MRHFSLYRYELPINSGLILRGQQQNYRSGLFCCLQENEKQGWGEISPLIGFSRETLSEAQNQTIQWLENWQQNKIDGVEKCHPSVAFGLSMALRELVQPFPKLKSLQTVPLCSDSSANTIHALQRTNPKIVKLKVGRYSPQQDAKNVQQLLTSCPKISLRLDANRAWSLDTALEFAKQLSLEEKARIEFIEEPCHTPAQSLQFAKNQQIRIAWDESIQDPKFQLHPQEWPSAIIIKPTLIGSLEKCLNLIEQAKSLCLTTVISSSIESSLGLSQLAQLAEYFTPDTPAGLDTLSLMQHQLIRPFPQSNLPLLGIDSQYIQQIH